MDYYAIVSMVVLALVALFALFNMFYMRTVHFRKAFALRLCAVLFFTRILERRCETFIKFICLYVYKLVKLVTHMCYHGVT